MNSLPRILGMGLLVVLAALVAVLAGAAWQAARLNSSAPQPSSTETSVAAPAQPAPAATRPALIARLTQRSALGLAVAAFALAVMLAFSLAPRPVWRTDTQRPFAASRSEMNALTSLAKSSVAQGEELNRERDVRRRAQEDAQLKQQLLTQSLDERIRLGRDLHDGIIQSLYAVGLTIESVRPLVRSNPPEADRRLESTRAGLNETIRDVRDYITGLAPENLRRGGFAHALGALLPELQASGTAEFDLSIDGEAAALLTPDQSLQALQIAREAVSNALRHGSATRVSLRMHHDNDKVCLLIQDNGTGFDPTHRRDGGHGLLNMEARARQLGATLHVTSRVNEGSRVLATLPVLKPADA